MSGMTNVFIKTLSSRNITLAVQYEDSVEILKEKLEAESGIPSKQQRLFYAGKEVDDCQKIMDFRGQRRHVCGVQPLQRGQCACAKTFTLAVRAPSSPLRPTSGKRKRTDSGDSEAPTFSQDLACVTCQADDLREPPTARPRTPHLRAQTSSESTLGAEGESKARDGSSGSSMRRGFLYELPGRKWLGSTLQALPPRVAGAATSIIDTLEALPTTVAEMAANTVSMFVTQMPNPGRGFSDVPITR